MLETLSKGVYFELFSNIVLASFVVCNVDVTLILETCSESVYLKPYLPSFAKCNVPIALMLETLSKGV